MASQALWRVDPKGAKGLDATFAYDWSPPSVNRNNRELTAGLRFNEPLPVHFHNFVSESEKKKPNPKAPRAYFFFFAPFFLGPPTLPHSRSTERQAVEGALANVQQSVELNCLLGLRRPTGREELWTKHVPHITERHGVVKVHWQRLIEPQPCSKFPVVAIDARRTPSRMQTLRPNPLPLSDPRAKGLGSPSSTRGSFPTAAVALVGDVNLPGL